MKRGFLNSSKAKRTPLGSVPSKTEPLNAGSSAGPPPARTTTGLSAETVTKLAYGKVENMGNFRSCRLCPANLNIISLDPMKTDHPANALLFATIPSHEPRDPDGTSEWIVVGATKAKVLNVPGYPQPVPKVVGPPAHLVKSTPNMGIGVFATRDIKFGELIFAERPLLVTPVNIALLHANVQVPVNYDINMQKAVLMFEWEKNLEVAVSRMSPENQAAFKSLMNSHKEDGSGPLLGVVRTNGFGIGNELFDGEHLDPNGHNGYTAIPKIGSRINHNCMPNVKVDFSLSSFSFKITAQVDIKAGDELFYAYCGVETSAAERQAALAPYGIVCDCPACLHATPETDRLRKEYHQRTRAYLQKFLQWKSRSGSLVAESVIEPALEFRNALIKEGLHWSSDYKAMVHLIQQFYEHLGLYEKAKPFKDEYARYKLPMVMVGNMPVFFVR